MIRSLKDGEKFKSRNNVTYTIISFIASGGQGEVYKVKDDHGKEFALKWYFKHSATPYQMELLTRLLGQGSPDARFLWPLDLVDGNGIFGYIMRLRPPEYKGIVDLMKRRIAPPFSVLCMAGINLAAGYKSLHSAGLCYRDISFGNLFFNPKNGSILICDNDNVTVNRDAKYSAEGTPRFIAPEIIVNKTPPSTDTDLYSMAVLLFYMFMWHHPLEGAIEANINVLDNLAMEKIYGKDPIFIWDPNNDTNRPVKGYQDNAIISWGLYPPQLRDLFTTSFTDGLRNPSKRIVENQWKRELSWLLNRIMKCTCGAEVFYRQSSTKCWKCGKDAPPPPRLNFGGSPENLVMLNADTIITNHHIVGDYDYDTQVAKLSKHPTENKWGIANLSTGNWTFTNTKGETQTVPPGKNAPLVIGAKINFGQAEATIEQ